MPGYYDIDEILAEEELVSVQTTFDFSYLSQLNPDANAYHGGQQHKLPKHVLPKDSILKLPLWALRGWLDVSYVFVRSLPKAYALSSREWLQADPVAVTTLAPRYFQAGRALLHVLEYSSHKQARTWKSTSQSQTVSLSREGQNRMERLEHVLQECVQLRETLLQTYTGDRLRATMNWALSSVGDDVSSYVHPLTDLERRLYRRAATAARNFVIYKQSSSNGSAAAAAASSQNRRRPKKRQSRTTSPTTVMAASVEPPRHGSDEPNRQHGQARAGNSTGTKRIRHY